MQSANGQENKRVVVVGGSSGIGLAIAEQAASRRAEVIVASSNAERIQKLLQPSGEKRRGMRLTSQMTPLAKPSLRRSVLSITWSSPPAYLHLNDLATTDLQQARRAFELRYWAALAAGKIRKHTCSSGWVYRPHNRDGQPAPTERMGRCRKCLRRVLINGSQWGARNVAHPLRRRGCTRMSLRQIRRLLIPPA